MFAQMFPGMGWIVAIVGLIIALLFLALVIGAILVVSGFLSSESWRKRLKLVASGMVLLTPPMFCLLGQSSVLPASNAELREKIATGMTVDEVRNILGNPSSQNWHDDGTGHIYYACDWWGFDIFCVRFDAQGRVENTAFVGTRRLLGPHATVGGEAVRARASGNLVIIHLATEAL